MKTPKGIDKHTGLDAIGFYFDFEKNIIKFHLDETNNIIEIPCELSKIQAELQRLYPKERNVGAKNEND